MKKIKNLFFVILSFAFTSMTAGAAIAATMVNVELVGVGDSQVRYGAYSGLYELETNGLDIINAMCDDRLTSVSIGDVWQATEFTYADIQAGAPVKFASLGIEKYSQVGYLFSLLGGVSFSNQADINLAVWEIMSPGSTSLTSVATVFYNTAISGSYDNFDFSGVMNVLTPDPLDASQEYLVSAVPIPTAIWLFGTGLIGIVGVSRRRA